jgi:hypothetical protein
MKLRTLFILSFSLLMISAKAQTNFDSIPDISDFTIDMFGQCYAIHGSEILKINKKAEIVKTFSKKDFGNPGILDARDPLRLLVFYQDFSIIRILDNEMAEQSIIDLRQLGFNDIRLICGGVDQGIWLYDRSSAQLIKLDVNLQRSLITIDLRQLLGKEINPSKMEQSQNWLLLQNGSDLLLFDRYGTYVRAISLAYTPVLLQIEENLLLSGTKDSLEITNLSLFNSTQKIVAILPDGIQKAAYFKEQFRYIKNNILYLPKP